MVQTKNQVGDNSNFGKNSNFGVNIREKIHFHLHVAGTPSAMNIQ